MMVLFCTIVGVPIWTVRRVRKQNVLKDKILTIVLGCILVPVIIGAGELLSVGLLIGLSTIFAPKDNTVHRNIGLPNKVSHATLERAPGAASSSHED